MTILARHESYNIHFLSIAVSILAISCYSRVKNVSELPHYEQASAHKHIAMESCVCVSWGSPQTKYRKIGGVVELINQLVDWFRIKTVFKLWFRYAWCNRKTKKRREENKKMGERRETGGDPNQNSERKRQIQWKKERRRKDNENSTVHLNLKVEMEIQDSPGPWNLKIPNPH